MTDNPFKRVKDEDLVYEIFSRVLGSLTDLANDPAIEANRRLEACQMMVNAANMLKNHTRINAILQDPEQRKDYLSGGRNLT